MSGPAAGAGDRAVPATATGAAPGVVPGQILPAEGTLTLNEGAPVTTLMVVNTGDRPVQVGSHYHFAQANPALAFDRDAGYGLRLDIPAGTAVRFEPGIERSVDLVPLAGARAVHGLTLPAPGALDAAAGAGPASPDRPDGEPPLTVEEVR